MAVKPKVLLSKWTRQQSQRIEAFVRLRRRRSLTYDEKMDILWAQATLRKENVTGVTGIIARLLGRAPKTVKDVLVEYLQTGDLSVSDAPSNTTTHGSRVPYTRAVRTLVRTFIRDRGVTRTRTVAKDVLSLLLDNNIVAVASGSPKDYASCLRSVQAFLAKEVYARGKRSVPTEYRMSKAQDARDAYVVMMVPTVTMMPRRPVVYLGENFIHHRYTRHDDSLYHPDDPATKPKHKGQRYCFVAGILDDGSDVAHLLGLDIFVGGKKNGKEVKDYHSMFNHDYFVDCFGKLLDEVEELGWSSSVKDDLYQACVKYNLASVAPTDLKTTIWKTLKKHLDEHVLPVVVQMAQSRGHHAGFSELRSIEMVWANVKGTFGRVYTSTTTFRDVLERLQRAFFELDGELILSTIESSTAKLLKLDRDLREAEAGVAIVSHRESDSETSASNECGSMSGGESYV
ncbi:hypothetical protein DYB30_010735 [Aphanomyces astaci]|uniref:Uncharacterized protein n=1 Tax=Aphanomyces astaci TaxID=112090 RepID=A0A397CQV8_APHAT|nr:hypothetical protein DYB30_010735 [Aphanomyces astaci]